MGSSQTQNPMLQGGQALGAGIGKGLKALFSSSKPSGTPSPADSTQLNTMGNGPGIQAPAAQALPDGTRTAARGGKIDTKDKLKAGGPVPGKAKVKGDSLKNDNVKALLSPGEIVVPRSIATHPHAPELAAKFVAATLAKQGMKRRG